MVFYLLCNYPRSNTFLSSENYPLWVGIVLGLTLNNCSILNKTSYKNFAAGMSRGAKLPASPVSPPHCCRPTLLSSIFRWGNNNYRLPRGVPVQDYVLHHYAHSPQKASWQRGSSLFKLLPFSCQKAKNCASKDVSSRITSSGGP